jgi:serine/threonine protein kinase
MAPEQFRNAKNVDPRCDIYALGATLYQMVTGELPFRSSGPLDAWMKKMHNELTPPRQINPGLSERIDWAIRRSMSADAEQRPASCREFVEDLTGRSTRKVSGPTSGEPAVQDLWFLVYKDEEGVSHTVKGSVAAVRRSLKDGLLGDASNIRASRVKTGPFEPLRGYPEFRDLVVAPAPLNLPASNAPTTEVPSAVDNSTSSLEETPIPRPVASARPKNQAASPSRSPSPPAGERGKMPHIDLQFSPPPAPKNREWLKWLLLVLMALATAIVTFFFLWW